jgi:uncharacterized RDD family membrane protein YckC
VSQPPGPGPYDGPPQPQPYGGQPQQPYGYPQQPAYPQQGPYGQPAYGQPSGHPGYPQQQNPYGYPAGPQGGPLPGMPPLAGWGSRLGATLLDGLMFFLIPYGLFMAGYLRLAAKISDRWKDCDKVGIPHDSCPTPKAPGGSVAMMLIGALLMLAVGIFLIHREGRTGQTPGKRIVGIRLLREYDGSTLGFGLAFGRRLLHVLDSLACGIGYLWPLWDDKRQTFADKIVHTVVIKDPQ